MPDITLYFLQASRSIRIAWLLEELGLDYKLEGWDREDTGFAPAGFKETCGTQLGKAPVLKDGSLILQESGAITEYVPHSRVNPNFCIIPTLISPFRYLCEHYDKAQRLIPANQAQRTKVREWIHAAEGAFMVHCLPLVYIRRNDATAAEKLAPSLTKYVAGDLDWLEAELKDGNGKYLVGDHVTAADTMLAFSIQFIFRMRLAPDHRKWERVEAWLKHIEGEESYRRAVKKTGHKL